MLPTIHHLGQPCSIIREYPRHSVQGLLLPDHHLIRLHAVPADNPADGQL
jgi:hypothetical protein